MKNQIKLYLYYKSNTRPTLISNSNTKLNTKLLTAKQFFYFIFFFNLLHNSKHETYFLKNDVVPSILIYKSKERLSNFLRAPYRHKKAQISLKRSFYNILLKYSFYLYNTSPIYHTLKYIDIIFHTFHFFDSPLVTLHKQKCVISSEVMIF